MKPRHRSAGFSVTIVQSIASRDLEAYFGSVFLAAKTPTEPGNGDEVAEFYTVVVIGLLEMIERMSNHQRMQFLAEAGKPRLSSPWPSGTGLLASERQTEKAGNQH
tara:strand:- start:339 stop:656 length:318 start_codon:yes stop_codon:yes gene_type:complete